MLKNKNKKDFINLLILLAIFLILILVITRFKFMYGSTLDWQTQHYAFKEYFRNLFYETFNLFPSFAFNLGAGENIYNMSYYGFLSPITLISYFLPFIKMIDYVMISSIILVGISIILFYKWLRSHSFNSNISFVSTLIFLCASPLIFHSHRHIMFIDYMPFLIMGLFGVDKYFKENKKTLLILSIFLIVMTSYYYSIPAIFTLIIYGVYLFIKNNKQITISQFIKEGIKFIIPIIIGIVMSSVLLIPTFYVIFNGRGSNDTLISLKNLLIPNIHLDYIMYNSYSVGLTSISLFSLISGIITKGKENKFLAITLSAILIFPIFIYILNGLLYINAKVLIPLLPMYVFLIANFLKSLINEKVNIKKLLAISLLVSLVPIITLKWSFKYQFIIDLILVTLAIIIYNYKKIKFLVPIIVMIISIVNLFTVNLTDNLLSIKDYNYKFNNEIDTLFNDALSLENNIYRSSNYVDTLVTTNKVYNKNYYSTSIYSSTYNKEYRTFYTETFSNPITYRNNIIINNPNNILWNTYMGVKYIVNTSSPSIGYELVNQTKNYSIYKNDNVYPLGYVNSNLMSKKEFEKLEYPYNVEALMNNVIIDGEVPDSNKFVSNIEPLEIDYSNSSYQNLDITKNDKEILIKSKTNGQITIPLTEEINNELIFIRFNMNYEETCKNGDTSITVNNVKNTLTCRSWKYKNSNSTFDYVISSNDPIKELNINLNKGTYNISDIKIYRLSYDNIKNITNTLDQFKFDKSKTKGDTIEGSIKVTKKGYFSLSIPYDKGFTILVNDKEIKYEKINQAFIGFPLDKGEYHIKIIYEAPFKNIAILMSFVGMLIFIIICIYEKRKKNEKRKN